MPELKKGLPGRARAGPGSLLRAVPGNGAVMRRDLHGSQRRVGGDVASGELFSGYHAAANVCTALAGLLGPPLSRLLWFPRPDAPDPPVHSRRPSSSSASRPFPKLSTFSIYASEAQCAGVCAKKKMMVQSWNSGETTLKRVRATRGAQAHILWLMLKFTGASSHRRADVSASCACKLR